MSFHWYYATPSKTGAHLKLSFDSKASENATHSFWFILRKQVDFDSSRTLGIYADEGITFRVSPEDACGIMLAIRTKGGHTWTYNYDHVTMDVRFRHFVKDGKELFGLGLKKNGAEIKIVFNPVEAERLMETLRFGLHHVFTGIWSAAVNEGKKRKKVAETKESKETQIKDIKRPELLEEPRDEEPAPVKEDRVIATLEDPDVEINDALF